jgi:hypothetical protein
MSLNRRADARRWRSSPKLETVLEPLLFQGTTVDAKGKELALALTLVAMFCVVFDRHSAQQKAKESGFCPCWSCGFSAELMLNEEESVVLCHCGINNIIVAV